MFTIHNDNNQNFKDKEYWKKWNYEIFKKKLNNYIQSQYILNSDLEEAIPKIRKKIFEDQDFITLTNRLLQYKPSNSSNNEFRKIKRVYKFNELLNPKKFDFIKKQFYIEEFNLILDLLFSKNFPYFSSTLENYINKNYKDLFQSLIILIANPYTTSFIPYYFYNIDDETKKNFFINYKDEIFFFNKYESDHIELITLKENLKNNPFFKKRFNEKFLNTIYSISYKYKTFGTLDFLIFYFFKDRKQQEAFLNTKPEIIDFIIYNTYPIFKREDNILFEIKEKILKRMVFSYGFFQIKKMIQKHQNIFRVVIYFDSQIGDYTIINNEILLIKKEFQNHNDFLLLRNHYYQISVYFKNQKENIYNFKNIWNSIKNKLTVDYKIKIKKYNIHNWNFLEL